NNAREYWRQIKPEVVDHYEAGIKHTIPNKASMGATIFKDLGKDRFLTYMSGATIPAQFNDPIGYYEIKGLEITGSFTPFRDFELFSAGTWMQSEAKGGNGQKSDKLPYTPGFQFQAGIKWTFLKKYKFFMDMQHLRDLYQGTFARSNTFNTPNITSKDRLNDITTLNARFAYMFHYKKMHITDSELSLAINNILNKRYEYAKGYPMPGITILGGMSLKFR
ncbi:MAG TPA: TonB-dependent receptor, partial [Syntrophorhabdaceae bacterium]|nr:TonB-dependent receptor [Syntrophorhabdaceae bacterium]